MGIADEVQKLDELHRTGSLSDEEYQHAKDQVLNGADHVIKDGRIHGVTEETWCLLLHLSLLLTFAGGVGIVAPIIMWVLGKDKSELVRVHGANVMNWLISSFIYIVVSLVFSSLLIGIPFLILFVVLDIAFPIVGAVKAGNNEVWRYPLSIEFIKP